MKLQWPLNWFKNIQVLPLEVLSTVHLLILILGEGDPGQVHPAHLHSTRCILDIPIKCLLVIIFSYELAQPGKKGVGGGQEVFWFYFAHFPNKSKKIYNLITFVYIFTQADIQDLDCVKFVLRASITVEIILKCLKVRRFLYLLIILHRMNSKFLIYW